MTMGDKADKICPLCTEEMDLTDQQLKPCNCGYEICVWCWHHIMDMAEKDATEGRCPACRTPYDKERIVRMASDKSLVAEIKVERKQKVQKAKPKASEARKHLGNVRVFQRNLVHVIGLPLSIADEELLKRREYFGQYGKVLKTCISRTASGTIQHSSNDCFSLYITFSKEEEAVRCIQLVHNFILEGRCLRACFGTTKYCNSWLKNAPCVNQHCLYLHEYGSEQDSFSKDEMASAFARVQQTIGAIQNMQLRSGYVLPSSADENNNVSPPIAAKTADKDSLQKMSSSDANTGKYVGPTPTASCVNVVPTWPSLSKSAALTGSGKQRADSARDALVPSPPVLSAKKSESAVVNGSKKKEETLHLHTDSKRDPSETTVQSVSRTHHAPSSNTKPHVLSTASPALMSPVNLSPGHSPPKQGSETIATSSIPTLPVAFTRQQSDRGPGQDKIVNTNIDGEIQSVSSESSSIGVYSSSIEDENSITDVTVPVNTSVGASSIDNVDHRKEDALAIDGQILKRSEGISHSTSLPFSQGFDESSNQSSWDSWKFDGAFIGNKNSTDPQQIPVKPDFSAFSLASLNTALDNKWLDSSERSSTRMDNMTGCSDLFEDMRKGSSLGRYGSDISNVKDHRNSNFGESHIISNILSMDRWEDGLTSSDNFAKLFAEADRQNGSHILRNAGKLPNASQSRFSFAQQEDLLIQEPDLEHRFGQAANQYLLRQNSVKTNSPPVENCQGTISYSSFAGYDSMHGQYFTANKLPESRSKVLAPPGFSASTKAPPPGFLSHERMDQAVGNLSANHLGHAPSFAGGRGHFPSNGNFAGPLDTELNDPAILEIGDRLPTTGLDQTSLNTWHNRYTRPNPSDYEGRLQFLMQKPVDVHQNPNLVDHFGNRFSTQNNVYNAPAFSDYSQRGNLSSFTPLTNQNSRNDQLSGSYWGGLNTANNVSDTRISNFLSNENFSGNKFVPGYEEAMLRMPGSSNMYNRGFGF